MPSLPEPLFEVVSKLDRSIRMTRSYWDYIVSVKHPSMRGLEDLVKDSLADPVEVRRSKRDRSVYLYYSKFNVRLFVCTASSR